MAEDVSVETLTDGLTLLVNLGKVLLQKAHEDAAGSLEDFVPYKITTLFGLITAGSNFYKSIGVKKKSEAEAVWQKSFHDAAVREQVDELLQLERRRCDSGSVPRSGTEAAAGPHQTFRMTAVTRPRGRAASQSGSA
ncbi:selenoprotein L [Scomber scombrus]|uniref:Selenoprotein L n=1 Tax=Scomber scombrus TaxID=13677 RepID=A0AAV1QJR8_SCOSC